jgi:hypothetical protein
MSRIGAYSSRRIDSRARERMMVPADLPDLMGIEKERSYLNLFFLESINIYKENSSSEDNALADKREV